MDVPKMTKMTPLSTGWGMCYLREGVYDSNGIYKRAFVGWIEVFDHSELGIKKPGETSWAVRIKHCEGSAFEMVVPGCQVRCVLKSSNRPVVSDNSFWQI